MNRTAAPDAEVPGPSSDAAAPSTGSGDTAPSAPRPPRPTVPLSTVIPLIVLFLGACISYGVGSTYSPYGTMFFGSNAILAPPQWGMERTMGPMSVPHPRMQLLFTPSHPRPQDMPDQFVFDWRLESAVDRSLAASGRVGFLGEYYRTNPTSPPVAEVPLPDIRGEYYLVVRPVGIGDFPDLDAYLTRVAPAREIAYIVAAITGAMFVALMAVAALRHRRAIVAWNEKGA